MSTAADKLKAKFNWKKIHTPKTWRPKDDDELVGYYGGRTLRNGTFGQYEVVLIHVPYQGTLSVSGTGLIQLIDGAMIEKGHPIRVKFLGLKELEDEKSFKQFELLVADGEAIAEEDLPEVQPS